MARRVLGWVFGKRPWGAVFSGLFVIGMSVVYIVLPHTDLTVGAIFLGLGVVGVMGGIAMRILTGSWRKAPQAPRHYAEGRFKPLS